MLDRVTSTKRLVTQAKPDLKIQILSLDFSIPQFTITKKIKFREHSPVLLLMVILVIVTCNGLSQAPSAVPHALRILSNLILTILSGFTNEETQVKRI